MIEKHIVLEDIDPVTFYGVNNGHLQMIKSLYPKTRIVARGNVLRVLGDEEDMAKVEEDIENKYPVHKTSSTLSAEDQQNGRPKNDNPTNANTIKSKTNNANGSPKPSAT